jgi:hypothetical protein
LLEWEGRDGLAVGTGGRGAKGGIVGHLDREESQFRAVNSRCAVVSLTDAMKRPKRPPMPKPMTPDMMAFPAQEFIASCAYIWFVSV